MTVAPALGQPGPSEGRGTAATVAEVIGGAGPAETRAAAKWVGAHAFVLELPEGYDTPVGLGGLPLPTRQRQRLDLARRFLAEPSGGDGARRSSPPLPPADAALPGLHLLLDAGAVTPILARVLGGDVHVRVRTIRYKPGKNVVVHYDVGTTTGWQEAVMYATSKPEALKANAAQPDRTTLARQARRPGIPAPLSFEPEVGALLVWLPLDLRLKALTLSGAELGRRLADAGLDVKGGEEPEILRYWARRRAVLGFGDHVVKLYRDPLDFAAAERGLRAAQHLAGVPTPALAAVLPSLRATVQHRVLGLAPRLGPADGGPVGALLGRLHRAALPASHQVATIDAGDLLAKAAGRARFVAHLVPGLREDVDALVGELEARRPPRTAVVTSHGNFHAGQLLATSGGLVMIDVDRLCHSHPAYDLASYAAHLTVGGNETAEEMDLVATALAGLVEGYGSAPEALGWFVATCLLRRAAVPFRYFDERWPDAAATLVRSARRTLDG